jgi:hypothetical protein
MELQVIEKNAELAKRLVEFVDKNNLSSNIAGKKYLQVEAWQFAGALVGTTPIVREVTHIESTAEIKYMAKVEVVNKEGTVISTGFAICSNKEYSKKKFDEYAIASMAQTRAIGKAYRNFLSWIVRLSGYEATPAEEINPDTAESELRQAKQDVFNRFKELNITDSSEMIATIQKATGKITIENHDDAMKVLMQLGDNNDDV